MTAPRFPEAVSDRTILSVLVLLTVIAAALRFYGLNSELWYDEIKTVLESVRPPLSVTLTDFPSNNDHPFFSLLSHLSVAALGEQAWTVRLPAALFGVATIPMLYYFGRDVAGRFEALLASAALAVSYHHIAFSQSARGYSMLLFFTLSTSWLALKAMKAPGYRIWAAYALAATLGCYTHITMVYVIAAQGLVVGVNWLMSLKGKFDLRPLYAPAFGFLLFVVATFLLYLPLFSGVEAYVEEKSGGTSTQIATPAWAALAAVQGLAEGFGGLWGAGAALTLLALGFVSYARRTPLLALMFVAPAPLVVLTALILGHAIRPRFLFVLAGFALLLLVRGAVLAARPVEAKLRPVMGRLPERSLAAAAILGLCIVSAASLPRNYSVPKQNFTGAIRFIEDHAAPGEAAYLVGNTAKVSIADYHGKAWPVIETPGAIAATKAPFWIAFTFRDYIVKGAPEMWRAISDHCMEAAAFEGTIAGGDVYVFRCGGNLTGL